ncbi:GH17807 [Drosophila grimshawi]|uniref:GH17807 n=2 Tax=Drosophila grimshawi TaxID=7222 RepID=B4JWR6_DROGR|nr:GH17807 [Drosophila grimshawi]
MVNDKDVDILRPLSDSEVDELMQLYSDKYGVLNFHYLLLYNQRKWDHQLDAAGISRDDEAHISMRKRFYTHRTGDFRRYGTYVSLHQDIVQSVSFFTWQPIEPVELFACLEQTQYIQWSKGALLTNVNLGFCERVKELATRKGAAGIQARQCHGMVLANADARGAKVPDQLSDFELRRLTVEDAALVHAKWTNNGEGSLAYIRALIEHNQTLGACRSDTGELIAWIFQNDFAGLGMLTVLAKVERRGLGGLLAAAITKLIAKREQVTLTAWIVDGNWRSEALLTRIGYKKSVVNEWIKLLPA